MVTRTWAVAIATIALIMGLLGGMMMWRPEPKNQEAHLQAHALEAKRKAIVALEEDVTELRRELEEGSKHIAKLQAKLDDANLAVHAAEQKIKSRSGESQLDEGRLARRDGATTESGRQVQADIYETSRTTSVYKEPSEFSRKLATIPEGTIVAVVGSTGQWLEVRSRHGNPPGFVHREDIRLVRKSGAEKEFTGTIAPG